MPSIPAAPRLRFTAPSARRKFSPAATCSIRSSCITFCREFRASRSGSRRHWPATVPPLLPPPAPRLVPPAGKDPAVRDSGKPLARYASRSSSFARWSFSPSLQRRYPPSRLLWLLLTSPPLSRGSSPGKALILSLRAVRLYLARLRMDFGLRGSQHANRPYAASLPICVPTVEGFVPRFLRLSSRGLRPATSAPRFPTVTSIGPGRIVSSC